MISTGARWTCVFVFGTAIWVNAIAEVHALELWNQWRGPHRDGSVREANWPDSLQDGALSETWRVKLGPSYSGPLVAEDRVFVTETVNREIEVVRALDRATGHELWRAQWEGAMTVPFFAKANGDWIRATPAFDGERLYVAGIRDVLVCLDATSGEELWRIDFVRQFGGKLPSFGFVSSPLVVGDHVFVQAGGSFAKIDKMTGEVVWRALQDDGGMFGSAFASPYLVELCGRSQFIVQTRKDLAGVDPQSGEVHWKEEIPAFRGMNILTPTVIGDGIFTSSYGGRSFMFTSTLSDGKWNLEETWSNKVQGYMSTPVILDGHVYLHLRNRRFTCIEAKSGKECWTTKPFAQYFSLVTDGTKILALDQRGELLLIRANPEQFELIDRRKVGDDSWAHLAVSGPDVCVRDLEWVAMYRWE